MRELENFRQKFPEYNDMDDLTLATKLAEKYPEYGDLVEKVKEPSPLARAKEIGKKVIYTGGPFYEPETGKIMPRLLGAVSPTIPRGRDWRELGKTLLAGMQVPEYAGHRAGLEAVTRTTGKRKFELVPPTPEVKQRANQIYWEGGMESKEQIARRLQEYEALTPQEKLTYDEGTDIGLQRSQKAELIKGASILAYIGYSGVQILRQMPAGMRANARIRDLVDHIAKLAKRTSKIRRPGTAVAEFHADLGRMLATDPTKPLAANLIRARQILPSLRISTPQQYNYVLKEFPATFKSIASAQVQPIPPETITHFTNRLAIVLKQSDTLAQGFNTALEELSSKSPALVSAFVNSVDALFKKATPTPEVPPAVPQVPLKATEMPPEAPIVTEPTIVAPEVASQEVRIQEILKTGKSLTNSEIAEKLGTPIGLSDQLITEQQKILSGIGKLLQKLKQEGKIKIEELEDFPYFKYKATKEFIKPPPPEKVIPQAIKEVKPEVKAEVPRSINDLVNAYNESGRVAFRYPRKKQISLDGITMSEKDAITKIKNVLAVKEPTPTITPEKPKEVIRREPERAVGVFEAKPEKVKPERALVKVRGEDFELVGVPKEKGLKPATRVRNEIAKYRKEMAKKKITEPLIARINKTKTRKDKVRIVRDYFKLTDAEVKSISRKDVGLMSDVQFKKFIDDVRVKAEDLALKKQVEIENIAAGYKPTAELVKPEAVPIEAVSSFDNFIDINRIKRKDIPYKEMDIAEIIRGDKTFPAIRQSGFFATKEIQTAPIRDIYKQTFSPYHASLAQDGYKLGGEFGTMFKKVWKPTEKAIRGQKEFSNLYFRTVKDTGKRHKIKTTGKNLEHLSDVIENKVKATPNEEVYVKELRGTLDDLRNQANEVREIMGKDKIGYIENYIPHIQKTTLWNELLSNKATISDNLDFIVPNQVKNPFSFKRMLEELPKAERNLYILLDRYIRAISKDIYITPAIENIKAYNSVLKNRELFNASKYWDEYIRYGLIGKQHKLDTALSIGQTGRKILKKWNSMVNLAFLTGKVSWNIATQPLSYIMNVPMEAGIINSITAIYKARGKSLREYVKKNSNVLAIKAGDVRAIAIGEGRNIQNRIYQTKIDKWNNFISMLGSVEERELTLVSYIAGLERAKNLGYKGQDALDFADLTAARTQSMYNKENRALILDSDIARTLFPFQSFSVEMFNHFKEIATKGGAEQLKGRQRLGKLFRLLFGLYLANLYSKALTGRKKTTVGTFIPFFGNYIDMLIAQATGQSYYGGRSPITVVQIGSDVIKGARDFIEYGNLKKLRKVGVNFGLALFGIGAGGQINNIIDGIMANIDEEVKNVKGDVMFEVKDALSKVIAPIFGVWATLEGREYFEPKAKKVPF